jgi:hypothetical protein
MRMPKTNSGQFWLMFAAQFLSYFLITADTLAITHQRYLTSGLVNGLISLETFLLSKLGVEHKEARTWWSGIGLVIGGILGAWASMWLIGR